MSDFIEKVKEFNELAGNKNEYNARKVTLYTGLIAEEFAELLESLKSTNPSDALAFKMLAEGVHEIADIFKNGDIEEDALIVDKVAFLDASTDIMVVACGAGITVGADVQGAAQEVMDSNLTKFPFDENGQRTVIKDENGKVKKPESYRPPQLEQFVK